MDNRNRPASLEAAMQELESNEPDRNNAESIAEKESANKKENRKNDKKKQGLFSRSKKKKLSKGEELAEIESFGKKTETTGGSEEQSGTEGERTKESSERVTGEEERKTEMSNVQETMQNQTEQSAQMSEPELVMEGIQVDTQKAKEPISEPGAPMEAEMGQNSALDPEPKSNLKPETVSELNPESEPEWEDSEEPLEEERFCLVDEKLSSAESVQYAAVPFESLRDMRTPFRCPGAIEVKEEFDDLNIDELDGVVRENNGVYEVLMMRPLNVAVLTMSENEARLTRLDELMKSRTDLRLSERIYAYLEEKKILQGSKDCLNLLQDPQTTSIDHAVANLNEVPKEMMDHFLNLEHLIRPLRSLVDYGLPILDAEKLAQLSTSTQNHLLSVLSQPECKAKLRSMNGEEWKQKFTSIIQALQKEPTVPEQELKEILIKEPSYTLTETQLQAIIQNALKAQQEELKK